MEIPLHARAAELMTRSRNQALVSVRTEGEPAAWRVLGDIFETAEAEVSAEDPRDDRLRAAWTDYVRAGSRRGMGSYGEDSADRRASATHR